jgi:hypothetical protein
MQSIVSLTEDHKVLTCTAALTKAYQLALGAMPDDTHGRLAKALELVEQGGVFESDRGHWEVQSQSQPGRVAPRSPQQCERAAADLWTGCPGDLA